MGSSPRPRLLLRAAFPAPMCLREWAACLREVPATQPAGCLEMRAEALRTSHLSALDSALAVGALLLAGAARREGGRALAELQAGGAPAPAPGTSSIEPPAGTIAAGESIEAAASSAAAAAEAAAALLSEVQGWGCQLAHNDLVRLRPGLRLTPPYCPPPRHTGLPLAHNLTC
jgi:hypothetical protein